MRSAEAAERIVDFATAEYRHGITRKRDGWKPRALETMRSLSVVSSSFAIRSLFYIFQMLGVACTHHNERNIGSLCRLLKQNPFLPPRVQILMGNGVGANCGHLSTYHILFINSHTFYNNWSTYDSRTESYFYHHSRCSEFR